MVPNSNSNKIGKLKEGFSFLIPFILFSFGFVSIVGYSSSSEAFGAVLAVSSMIMLASFSSGGFLGFLFGIPKTKDIEKSGVKSNSNLEELSDWLTKIIVGVSLIESKQIIEVVISSAHSLSEGIGPSEYSFAFILTIMIFYFVGGFFVSYIWTRIYFEKILKRHMNDDLTIVVESMQKNQDYEKQVDELENRFDLNSAFKILDDVITGSTDEQKTNIFNKIISAAYVNTRYQEIVDLANKYENQLTVTYTTWGLIGIANMNWYADKLNPVQKSDTLIAIERANRVQPDYGTPYCVNLYLELIDLFNNKDNKSEIAINARKSIDIIVNKLLASSEFTVYEAMNYFHQHDVTNNRWGDYNKIFMNDFEEQFKKLEKIYANYKTSHNY